MTIDTNEETIIDSEETNEDELELETEESTEEPVSEGENEGETTEKPKETPEAKRARLKRQLEQLDKKHGFKDAEVKPVSKPGELSPKDVLVLAKADIHEDDIEDVVKWAKFEGISVSEALRSDHIKALTSTRAEQRKTAEATHTGTARRSSQKLTDEALLESASSGKIPESDEEIARLIKAKATKKN